MLFGALTAASAAEEPSTTPLGEATFQRICAACHTTLVSRASPSPDHPPDPAVLRALPREMLRQLPAEAVLTALTSGKMQAQGSLLTDAERHAVAEYASGSHFGAAAYGSVNTEKPNLCKSPASVNKAAPAWNGWGNGLANERFQPKSTGGLTAADLPKLKLKWAFGYTNTVTLRAQPTVFGHRLFVATDSGEVYALDAKTGCTYWTYMAQAAVATAPIVAAYKTPGGGERLRRLIGRPQGQRLCPGCQQRRAPLETQNRRTPRRRDNRLTSAIRRPTLRPGARCR